MRAALLFLLLTVPANAACQGDDAFFCTVGSKSLQLCHQDGALIYSFGPKGKPDLTLSEPMATVDYIPWSGWGRNRFYTVTFRNQGFAYEVWTGFDRSGSPRGIDGGVTVRNGGETVAELTCDWGSATRELDSLSDLKSDLHQCFDQKSGTWRTAPCGEDPALCAC